MATKLVQKDLLKGTRTFEIVDDAVNVVIKAPFNKQETLTVMMSVLNPEPVISKSQLEFTSRVNNEPLISLYLAKPNPDEFNAFVNLLKQKAQEAYKSFAGLKSATAPVLEGNVYEEPPEFDAPDTATRPSSKKHLRADRIEEAVRLLSEYMETDELGPFISALEKLQSDPMNDAYWSQVVKEFDDLGPAQGAVLAYAPYISILLSDDPFG